MVVLQEVKPDGSHGEPEEIRATDSEAGESDEDDFHSFGDQTGSSELSDDMLDLGMGDDSDSDGDFFESDEDHQEEGEEQDEDDVEIESAEEEEDEDASGEEGEEEVEGDEEEEVENDDDEEVLEESDDDLDEQEASGVEEDGEDDAVAEEVSDDGTVDFEQDAVGSEEESENEQDGEEEELEEEEIQSNEEEEVSTSASASTEKQQKTARDGSALKDIKGESVIDELPGEDWRADAQAFKDKEAKKGVIYMASVPPYMKVDKVRSLLSKHGEVLRIFLRPEDQSEARRRKKAGGNKKTKFRDGWIEFADKKAARRCAELLNCQAIGGKKRHWKHDIWNLKYLPKFKWMHLMEFQHYQSQVRKTRLRTQVEQVRKENQFYREQVDRKKGIDAIKTKRDKKNKKINKAVSASQQPDDRFSTAKLAEGDAKISKKRKADSASAPAAKKSKNFRKLA